MPSTPKPLQLEGLVEDVRNDDPFDADLRKENARLGDQILALRRELEDANRDKQRLARSIENLRTTLNPLYRGLRALFGEIELAIGEEAAASAPPNGAANSTGPSAQTNPRFQSFKNSFPGRGAEILDALAIHGEMRISHLATLLRCDPRTIGQHAAKLRNAGAISQTQGLLSLKL